ncbi:MAG: gamma carbonic anhydrase family protein, partial [Gammaproteobacteria bacterium]|nr:gamma carbonic anhydrase family protein [Gammaproteobacteria bacterium]
MIFTLTGRTPRLHADSYIAPSADLIGSVVLGEKASVWFGAVLRADNDFIRIGARSNVQDGAVLHVDPGVPIAVGEQV